MLEPSSADRQTDATERIQSTNQSLFQAQGPRDTERESLFTTNDI